MYSCNVKSLSTDTTAVRAEGRQKQWLPSVSVHNFLIGISSCTDEEKRFKSFFNTCKGKWVVSELMLQFSDILVYLFCMFELLCIRVRIFSE